MGSPQQQISYREKAFFEWIQGDALQQELIEHLAPKSCAGFSVTGKGKI